MDDLEHLINTMDSARHQRFDLSRRLYGRYITTLRDKTLSGEVKRWVDGTIASLSGAHPEGRILAVIGASGTGKTWAIERAIDSIPGLKEAILCVTAPRPCPAGGRAPRLRRLDPGR
ncbi:protein of unknown function [Magnetospirillum sp. XM-1]|uniref:hypothetical protein n=1 Tax=Magnetospirillum sp. XM-1 TaxID=1663591 RepID=UPI00073DFA96|nr:hypothetical protein [Magnetospirillum sp. XM-1]CUW40614.1 protein of unknown function [Magnetospirillum sp. XM-1]